MSFIPHENNADMIPFEDSCPYLGLDPSGQPKCEADDIMEAYLQEMYPASLCLSPTENWIECVYFKRAKLL